VSEGKQQKFEVEQGFAGMETEKENLKGVKAHKPYTKDDVLQHLDDLIQVETVNDLQRRDIERVTEFVQYCLGLDQFGLQPNWDGLIGQIGLCRMRWNLRQNYGSYVAPTFFIVRRIEDA
jgi:hypothetical protein